MTSKTFSQRALVARAKELEQKKNILEGSRAYLSGPMDFVASRAEEKRNGWRNRIGQFLQKYDVTVYDPWNKPTVAGMPHYGKEDEFTTNERHKWTFEDTEEGDITRATLSDHFWPTLHIDLRMVDTSDFLVAYCPTNIYSVGTVHEIVMARLQHKPVLFVSPPVAFPAFDELEEHLKNTGDEAAQALLEELRTEVPLRPNPDAVPSLWYMGLIDGHYFFDGFGFADYMDEFNWTPGELDEREEQFPPKRPLLPYLEKFTRHLPPRYDLEQQKYVENADWLILKTDNKYE